MNKPACENFSPHISPSEDDTTLAQSTVSQDLKISKKPVGFKRCGQGSGVAAALSAQHQMPPQELPWELMEEAQRRLDVD